MVRFLQLTRQKNTKTVAVARLATCLDPGGPGQARSGATYAAMT